MSQIPLPPARGGVGQGPALVEAVIHAAFDLAPSLVDGIHKNNLAPFVPPNVPPGRRHRQPILEPHPDLVREDASDETDEQNEESGDHKIIQKILHWP